MKPAYVVIGKTEQGYFLVLSQKDKESDPAICAWESEVDALLAFQDPLSEGYRRGGGFATGALLASIQFEASVILAPPPDKIEEVLLKGVTDMHPCHLRSGVGIDILGLKLNDETAAPLWEAGKKPQLIPGHVHPSVDPVQFLANASVNRRKPKNKNAVEGEDYRIVDGVEKNRKYPDTYEIPTEDEKKAVQPGSLVKIHLEGIKEKGGDKFWVRVTEVAYPLFKGKIDNDLVYGWIHGFDYEDEIAFTANNILSTSTPPPEKPTHLPS